jgi:hypothetical protein
VAVKTWTAEDGKFSVSVMRDPRQTKLMPPQAPVEMQQYTFSSPSAQGAIMVVVAELPIGKDASDEVRKQTLQDAKKGMIGQYRAQVDEEKQVTVDGNVGLDLRISANHPQAGQMVGRLRLVLRGQKLYQLLYIGAKNAKSLHAEGDQLIESFRLL